MEARIALPIRLAERGWIPDRWIRLGVRQLLRRRRRVAHTTGTALFASQMGEQRVAVATDAANEQHYEVPAAFFEQVLGPSLKYSCALFDRPDSQLADAELAMLETVCRRARLEDGMRVMDLGCGWGALALHVARRFPGSDVLAVSNSKSQREFIEARAAREGLKGLRVITRDVNRLQPDERFDRVVSVEMFEHVRNWGTLLRSIAGWLEPGGEVFLHVFCHRDTPYLFEGDGPTDWMGRYFFTGGIMPSAELIDAFPEALSVRERWTVSGTHYRDTAEAWLRNLDAQRDRVRAILERDGRADAELWIQRWRMFFIAVAELFGYANGSEWFVQHYRLEPRA